MTRHLCTAALRRNGSGRVPMRVRKAHVPSVSSGPLQIHSLVFSSLPSAPWAGLSVLHAQAPFPPAPGLAGSMGVGGGRGRRLEGRRRVKLEGLTAGWLPSHGVSGWLYPSAEGPSPSQNDRLHLTVSFQIPVRLSSLPRRPRAGKSPQSAISPTPALCLLAAPYPAHVSLPGLLKLPYFECAICLPMARTDRARFGEPALGRKWSCSV